MSFGAIAFTLTATGKATRRVSTGVAFAISFGGYILASLAGLSKYIEFPARLLPYNYFNPTDILAGMSKRACICSIL